jgi:hypothetical protein
MPTLWKCPEGHEWQVTADGQATAAEGPPRCPVCGSAAESPESLAVAGTAATVAPPVSEQPTLPPRTSSAESATPSEMAPVAAEAALTADLLPRVPGFDMLAELGRGGMGVVYKANQSRLDRLVAIKILPAEAGRDPAFAARFTREAKSLARLNHPNIITIYDFGQADDQSYFVMEFVEGANLRQRIRAGRMPPQEVFRVVGQICDALEYAHERGIVHRDIKPENILLDPRGRVKTGPWQMVGTFHYMAPEQLDNPLGLDHRADIYSLGVVMYEMLTGHRPVGRFEPPSHLAAVDPRVDAVVLKALEREPARRFGSAAELKVALESIGAAAPAPVPTKELTPRATPVPGETTAPLSLDPHPPALDLLPVWQAMQWLGVGLMVLGFVAGAVTGGLGLALLGAGLGVILVAVGTLRRLQPARRSPKTATQRERETIRQRVKAPALGLLISGIIGCGFWGIFASLELVPRQVFAAAADPSHPAAAVPGLMFLLAALGFLQGVVVVVGALKMRDLEAYGLARLSSVLAMVPLSPAIVLGLPVGIWSLVVLNRPEVRAAFAGLSNSAAPSSRAAVGQEVLVEPAARPAAPLTARDRTLPGHAEERPAPADLNPVWQNLRWLAAGILLLGMMALFGGIYVLPGEVRVRSFLVATGIAVVLFLVANGPRILPRLLSSAAAGRWSCLFWAWLSA